MSSTDSAPYIDYLLRSVAKKRNQAFWISSDKALFPGGRNGPYLDIESPIRNSAHWAITLAVASYLDPDSNSGPTAEALSRFLVDDRMFVSNGFHISRQNGTKDWSNGVIGPAWICESLWHVGSIMKHEESKKRALTLARSIPFSERRGLWMIPSAGPGAVGFDLTFNHQSWLAAVVGEIADGSGDQELTKKVTHFLEVSAEKYFQVNESGIIRHAIPEELSVYSVIRRTKARIGSTFKGKTKRPISSVERALGYHIFVLYSLARLRRCYPGYRIWKLRPVIEAVSVLADRNFIKALEDNEFSYPYNPPGFEAPLVEATFSDIAPEIKGVGAMLMNRQIDLTWSEEPAAFVRKTEDPITLSARVYELALSIHLMNGKFNRS